MAVTERCYRPQDTGLFPDRRPQAAESGAERALAREEAPMFEQELELERKSSSVVPLLLIIALAGVIVGTAGYWYVQSKKVLTQPEATAVGESILKAQGPAVLRFHTGRVKSSINEKPRDPHYKLLEKAGYVKLSPVKGKFETVDIALTPKGDKDLPAFPEFQKAQEKD